MVTYKSDRRNGSNLKCRTYKCASGPNGVAKSRTQMGALGTLGQCGLQAEVSGAARQTWTTSVGTLDMVGQVARQQGLGCNKQLRVEHDTGHKRASADHIGYWPTSVANHRLSHEDVELSRGEPRVHLVNEHDG